MVGRTVIACIVGLLIVWVALAILLVVVRPPGQSLADLAHVFPNTLRLTVALYRDPSLPRSVRWRLRVAVIYNSAPRSR